MIKGVNLGNWLVLEKWMSPELFDGTTAEDETYLCKQLSEEAKRERLKVHRDSYITGRDFAYLAEKGIDVVRIPIPFFIFGDFEPYVGCVQYLDKAFDWAEKYAALVSEQCKLYLQPEWGKASIVTPVIIDYIKANPKWELSLQIHKYINVP